MASIGLRFNILAVNRASGPLNDVGDSARRAGGHLAGIGKAAAIGLGGAALGAIAGFGAAMKGGFEEAISYQRITDQLRQTLKATGGAAGVSVEHLKAYAGQLESISGVDEELILNSQNVLATFTGIRNEVGKGNDIFDQASLAALNMSTTLGTDTSSAAVQLGKALNNPTKGITALSKAGVSFTEAQKKQIAAMQESGDLMGAQKIILGELNKEFGGAAAAAGKGLGGSIARLKDTFSDTFRDIATRALPTLSKLADWLAKVLPGAIAKTFEFFGRLKNVASQVFGVLFKGDFTGGGPFEEDSPFIIGLFRAREILGKVADFVSTKVVPAYKAWISFVFTQAVPAIARFTATMSERLGPVLVQVGKFLRDQLLPVFKTMWASIQTNLIPAFQGLVVRIRENKDLFITIGKVMAGVAAVVIIVWAKIQKFLIPILATLIRFNIAVIGKIIGVVAAFTRFGVKLVEIGAAVGRFIAKAVGLIKEFPGRAAAALAALPGKLLGAARTGMNGLKAGISEGAKTAIDFLTGLPGQFVDAVGDLAGVLYQKGVDLIQGLIEGIKDAAANIPSAVGGAIKDGIGGIAGGITSRIPGLGGLRAAGPVGTTAPVPPVGSAAPALGGGGFTSSRDPVLTEIRAQTRATYALLAGVERLAGTPQQAATMQRTRMYGVSR